MTEKSLRGWINTSSKEAGVTVSVSKMNSSRKALTETRILDNTGVKLMLDMTVTDTHGTK